MVKNLSTLGAIVDLISVVGNADDAGHACQACSPRMAQLISLLMRHVPRP